MQTVKIKITRVLPARVFPPATRGVLIPKRFRAPFKGKVMEAILAEDGSGTCSVSVLDLLNSQPPYGKLRNWWLNNLLARDIVGMRIFPSRKFYKKIQ